MLPWAKLSTFCVKLVQLEKAQWKRRQKKKPLSVYVGFDNIKSLWSLSLFFSCLNPSSLSLCQILKTSTLKNNLQPPNKRETVLSLCLIPASDHVAHWHDVMHFWRTESCTSTIRQEERKNGFSLCTNQLSLLKFEAVCVCIDTSCAYRTEKWHLKSIKAFLQEGSVSLLHNSVFIFETIHHYTMSNEAE